MAGPSELAFVIPGSPVPFARAGANGKQRFTPKKQRSYMTDVKHFGSLAMDGRPLMDGPIQLDVEAIYVVPASWSKKRRAEAWWKTGKPDFDNLGKIVADSLNGIAYADDAQIVDGRVRKRFGDRSEIRVTLRVLG